MAIIGIFFGSDTGNTENIAKMIQKQLGKDVADVHDIAKSSKEDLEAHDILLLGIPTVLRRSPVRLGRFLPDAGRDRFQWQTGGSVWLWRSGRLC